MSTTAVTVKTETKTKKPVAVKTETKTKNPVAVKTETKAVEQHKVEVNGSYDFLVEHFHQPSTIIDAATALAELNKIDPNIAAKKVETFLENAKVDRTLEVKAGTDSNEGQFLISRVPQSAQRKNGGREVKKTAVVKDRQRSPGLVKFVLDHLTKPIDRGGLVKALHKKFPDRDEESLGRTASFLLGGYLKKRHKVVTKKENDITYYHLA